MYVLKKGTSPSVIKYLSQQEASSQTKNFQLATTEGYKWLQNKYQYCKREEQVRAVRPQLFISLHKPITKDIVCW